MNDWACNQKPKQGQFNAMKQKSEFELKSDRLIDLTDIISHIICIQVRNFQWCYIWFKSHRIIVDIISKITALLSKVFCFSVKLHGIVNSTVKQHSIINVKNSMKWQWWRHSWHARANAFAEIPLPWPLPWQSKVIIIKLYIKIFWSPLLKRLMDCLCPVMSSGLAVKWI